MKEENLHEIVKNKLISIFGTESVLIGLLEDPEFEAKLQEFTEWLVGKIILEYRLGLMPPSPESAHTITTKRVYTWDKNWGTSLKEFKIKNAVPEWQRNWEARRLC